MLAKAFSVLLAVSSASIASNASACQHLVQKSITFDAASIGLDTPQIVELAAWLRDASSRYPAFASASIEAGASLTTPEEPLSGAAERAKRRAESTARALKTLWSADIQVQTVSHTYRQKSEFGSSNDFAVIELYPDQKASPLPDCNPVPLPGFQPRR